ncbi:MAG: hypothetical protein AAF986_06665 [Pseudomonadota bacterium]
MTYSPPPAARRTDNFTIEGWSLLPGEAMLEARFTCSEHGPFCERVQFASSHEAVHHYLANEGKGLGALLAVALGVSYYKVGAARLIHLPKLSAAGQAMAHALYTEGLAEFFVRAGLPFPPDVTVQGDIIPANNNEPTPAPDADAFKESALVAFGGGKDSYVARAILKASNVPVTLSAVILSDAVKDAISATAPEPVQFLRRQLDPRLTEATKKGFNGHVPITAINMLMLTIEAGASKKRQVVFANERSADEPTMLLNDRAANHQYSKSSTFETLIRNAIGESTPSAPVLYSLLRPYSELWIGRVFSSLKEPFGRFTSCNKNFRLAGDAQQRWCGACAKCAFTSLILSPFIDEQEAQQIFGRLFLDEPDLQPFYEELLGLSEQKPWDCVGTIDECRIALWRASQRQPWQNTRAVRTFMPRILERLDESTLLALEVRAFEVAPTPIIPEALLDEAEELSS